ncbi:hypothetical protein [Corynebacterium propinquum]|uniref:hypothetical protein n=1 Tax=Corynebacterium propinquum TaxID=43769 RepID=UPI0006683333|nr:hypothetical protein [Corynebacterium propinquum]MCG7231570.1 hypothetical protein [Corynebacterium propinquum]MDK4234363.1 hypothetical protein [Corynebacterium propinquum]MDK4319137.1 hypothetical protein [Corynebacterium propinquum]MDK8534855.1 hypothetical protein [Corynebacterium propinquum]PZQ26863.1 MAG: hypothetical protein DI558_02910 [Corynebacterium propinquum]
MSVQLFESWSVDQLKAERDRVESQMAPFTVEILRRLRESDSLEFEEQRLLEQYETLTWLIYG